MPQARHGLFRFGAFVAARGHLHRSMFGYRPPNISTLTTLNLSPSSVSHNSSRGRDGYRLSLMFRCRMRSPTSCICSTSSSVISTLANWASIASISSTRSSKSAPRSFVKCVSLVTNSISTRSCLATRVRTSLMEKHSLKGGGCLSGVELPMFMIKPPDSIGARNSVQINAPGSVTLI